MTFVHTTPQIRPKFRCVHLGVNQRCWDLQKESAISNLCNHGRGVFYWYMYLVKHEFVELLSI